MIDFIHKHEVTQGRDVMYATYVLDYRPLKNEPNRVKITVGGDRLSYDNDAGFPAENLLETKVLLNSTISDACKGARFMTADIKYYFLATSMAKAEYMKVRYNHISDDIKHQYNLQEKLNANDYIYICIKKAMYSLKQAAILAYDNLQANLKPFGNPLSSGPSDYGNMNHVQPLFACVSMSSASNTTSKKMINTS